MTAKKFIVPGIAIALLFSVTTLMAWWPFSDDKNDAGSSGASQSEVKELGWPDLIPDDFVQPENPFATMSQEEVDKLLDGSDESNAKLDKLEAEFNYAPVVPELDGQRVSFPAYITPLEFNEQSTLKEFLLVPYVGACIHTPPPPANQIVHAQSEKGVKSNGMYEPVVATGIIRTETVKSAMAESGYRLEVESIKPYTETE